MRRDKAGCAYPRASVEEMTAYGFVADWIVAHAVVGLSAAFADC